MEQQQIKQKIAELKSQYLRLALSCRSAGIRVNPQTINSYQKDIAQLEAQIQ
ncbi:MAG: 50S ribosomal protein L29 [Nanoarchaeota archaeon]